MGSLLTAAVSVLLGVSPAIAQEGNWDAPAVIPDSNVLQAWQDYPHSVPKPDGFIVGVIFQSEGISFDQFQKALRTEDTQEQLADVMRTNYEGALYGNPLTIEFSEEHRKVERTIEQASSHDEGIFEDAIVHTDRFSSVGESIGVEVFKSMAWQDPIGQVTYIHYSNPDGWAETDMTCLARQVLTILYTDDDGSGYDVQACLDEAMQ